MKLRLCRNRERERELYFVLFKILMCMNECMKVKAKAHFVLLNTLQIMKTTHIE